MFLLFLILLLGLFSKAIWKKTWRHTKELENAFYVDVTKNINQL